MYIELNIDKELLDWKEEPKRKPLGWSDNGEINVLEMGHSSAIANDTVNSHIGACPFCGTYNNGYPNYGTKHVKKIGLCRNDINPSR